MAFNNCFKDKKVIVTGHTGFKGSWLTTWLLELGAQVIGISKDIPTKPSLFEELALEKKITHHFADIRHAESVKDLITNAQPDVVFHLAAQPIVSTSYENPVETFETNVMGTTHLLEALRSLQKRCHAVLITSDKCYDNVEWLWGYREHDPLGGKDPYSASKGAAELVIKAYFHSYFNKPDSHIKLVSVRAGNVIGGGDWAANRIVPDCIKAWQNGTPVKLRNPSATRPWQHVLEPLSGYLRAAQLLIENQEHLHGEPFNFGPAADQHHTVLALLENISNHWNFGDMKEIFILENKKIYHEAGLLKLNCDKALSLLQWKAVLNFEQTSSFTGNWYNAYYNDRKQPLYDYTIGQIKEYWHLAKQLSLAWT